MTNCNEGGNVHLWAYPDFDKEYSQFRICMYCKQSQTKAWKNDTKDGEAKDDIPRTTKQKESKI